jgi:hypothetical protein
VKTPIEQERLGVYYTVPIAIKGTTIMQLQPLLIA